MAGQSVFVTGADDGNHNLILETVSRGGSRFIMVQEYISEIASSSAKLAAAAPP